MALTDKFENVLVRRDENQIVWITLNRPEQRNAQSMALVKDMNRIMDDLAKDPDVRVAVLTGSGTAFASGMNLKDLLDFRTSHKTYEENYGANAAGEGQGPLEWWEKWRTLPIPTISAVNGHTYGGGIPPATYADITIASDRAMFGLSEINWGVGPGGGATRAVLEYVPLKWTKWMAMVGDPIDAETAARIGLVNYVVPHDQLLEEAHKVAMKFVKHPHHATVATKFQIDASREIHHHDIAVLVEDAALSESSRRTQDKSGTVGLTKFKEGVYRPGLEAYDFRKDKEGKK